MKCDEFRKKMDDFLDGKLGWDEAREMERHIEECEECRQLYLTELFLRKELKELTPDAPSAAELLRSVRRKEARGKRSVPAFALRLGFGFAALVVIAFAASKTVLKTEQAVSAELPPAVVSPVDGDVVLPTEANIILFVPDPEYHVNVEIDGEPVEVNHIDRGNVVVAYPPNIEPGYHYARIDFYNTRSKETITNSAVFYVVGDRQ